MIAPDLLEIMCCPETHQGLAIAKDELVTRLNQQVQGKTLKNRAGKTVVDLFDGGLIRADHKVLYPIRGKIPIMLIDEGIVLEV